MMIKVITGINNKIMIHATCTQVLKVKMALSNKLKKLLRCVMSVVNSVKNFMKSNFTVGVLLLKSQKDDQMTSSHNLIPWRNHEMK